MLGSTRVEVSVPIENCVKYNIEEWHKYDDDKVTEVKLEDVLGLRGGGDWHMAYILIYRKIEIV